MSEENNNIKTIYKRLDLSKVDYHTRHLEIINPILKIRLTPKEIEILAEFMSLDGILAELRFGPTAKKVIREKLELSPAALSNHISNLFDKGYLIKNGDVVTIKKLLIPYSDEQFYHYRIKLIPDAITRPE